LILSCFLAQHRVVAVELGDVACRLLLADSVEGIDVSVAAELLDLILVQTSSHCFPPDRLA
jgi:hypothetical protein